MNFLADTNVVSELRKGPGANKCVVEWFEPLASDQVFVSVVTIGEIRKGIEGIRGRDRRTTDRLEDWLRDLMRIYADRVLPIDTVVAEEWGRMSASNPLPVLDALIAATAKVHGLVVATRNTKDIRRTGVRCVNPFESSATSSETS